MREFSTRDYEDGKAKMITDDLRVKSVDDQPWRPTLFQTLEAVTNTLDAGPPSVGVNLNTGEMFDAPLWRVVEGLASGAHPGHVLTIEIKKTPNDS